MAYAKGRRMELKMDQTSTSALAPESEGTATPLQKIAEHVFPRKGATLLGVVLGILLGTGNVVIGLVFPSWPATLGLLAVAVLVVVVLHEGLHGATGSLLGYRPMFGMKPPRMFTTFDREIRRDHLLMIALAPLVILDTAFIAAYLTVPGKVFWDLCFAVNTLGAIGDVWIATCILRYPPDTLFQDTNNGVEVWASKGPQKSREACSDPGASD